MNSAISSKESLLFNQNGCREELQAGQRSNPASSICYCSLKNISIENSAIELKAKDSFERQSPIGGLVKSRPLLASDTDVFYRNRGGKDSDLDDNEDQSDDESSTDSEENLFPEPPDGGYGWVIVAAAFLSSLIVDGVTFSFGILYPEIQAYFKASKGQSAVVGSLFFSLPLLAGPIAGALIDRYDCRPVLVVGAVITFVGFLLSSFAPTIPILCLSLGVLGGFGVALVSTAPIVAVTYYFDKRRSLATGITVCGSGIGTFVFAPLIEYLLTEYLWKGAMLILSGISLHLLICGALARDLEWPEESFEHKRDKFLRSLETASKGNTSHMSTTGDSVSAYLIGQDIYTSMAWDTRKAFSLFEIPTYLQSDNSHLLPSSNEERHREKAGSIRELSITGQAKVMAKRGESEAQKSTGQASRSKSMVAGLARRMTLPEVGLTFHLQPDSTVNKNADAHSCTSSYYVEADDSLTIGTLRSSEDSVANIKDKNAEKLLCEVTSDGKCIELRRLHSISASPEFPNPLPVLSKSKSLDMSQSFLLGINLLQASGKGGSYRVDGENLHHKPLLFKIEDLHKNMFNNENCKMIDSNKSQAIALTNNPSLETNIVLPSSDKSELSNLLHNVKESDKTAKPSDDCINTDEGEHVLPIAIANGGLYSKRHHHHTMSHCEKRHHSIPHQSSLNVNRRVRAVVGRAVGAGVGTGFLPRYTYRVFSAPELQIHKRRRHKKAIKIRKVFKEIWCTVKVDVKLMRNMRFLLFALSNFLLYAFYDIPYVNLPDYVEELHVFSSDKASFLVSVIGISNTIGMLILGCLGDRKWCNRELLYSSSMFVCGICVLLVPWLNGSYPGYCAISCIFGFFISTNYALTSVILVDLVSLSNFVYAYGLLGFVQGIGNLIGPALAGYMYVWTGSYKATFISGGVAIILSGGLVLAIPVFFRRKSYNRASADAMPDEMGYIVETTDDIVRLTKKEQPASKIKDGAQVKSPTLKHGNIISKKE